MTGDLIKPTIFGWKKKNYRYWLYPDIRFKGQILEYADWDGISTEVQNLRIAESILSLWRAKRR